MEFTFMFDGVRGHVDAHGFVQWGGMGFQIEAANAAMRKRIECARAWAKLRKAR